MILRQEAKFIKKNTIGALCYFSNGDYQTYEKMAFGQSIIEAKEASQISVPE